MGILIFKTCMDSNVPHVMCLHGFLQAMMNECLKKSCSGSGYFHYPGGTLEIDHTGTFR